MSHELVHVQTADGVRLDGTLERPDEGRSSRLCLDVVILHHGYGANFYAANLFDGIAHHFVDQGCAVLRVNSRGHDYAFGGPRGRLGAAYELIEDCRFDWKSWIDFASSLGYERIGLWGQSLGAVKTICYLATQPEDRIVCAIASSPPLLSLSKGLERIEGDALRQQVATAAKMVERGEAEAILPSVFYFPRMKTARSFLDTYNSLETYNVFNQLPEIKVPMLLTIGGEEGLGPQNPDWFNFGGYVARVEELSMRLPRLSFEMIGGANHAYAGKVNDLWNAAKRWLGRVANPVV